MSIKYNHEAIISVSTLTSENYFYTNIDEILQNAQTNLKSANIQISGNDVNNDTIVDLISGKVSFVANSSEIISIDIMFFVTAEINVLIFYKIFSSWEK